MGAHDHDHEHAPSGSARVLSIALAVTLGYMVLEAIAGFLTGSLALLADAAHMLSDSAALVVALAAAQLAQRPPDPRRTMGYHRAEVLGAALNAGALVALSVWIAVEAVERLSAPRAVDAPPMMVVAAFGLALNLGVAWFLHRGSRDLNLRAALWHVLGDALGSVGALVAGALILFGGQLWADPAVSIAIAAILVVGSVGVLREVSGVLMQGAPADVDVPHLEEAIRGVPGVVSVHDLHVWTLRPGHDVLTVHVVVDDRHEAALVCARVREAVRVEVPGAHVTVQPEPTAAACRAEERALHH